VECAPSSAPPPAKGTTAALRIGASSGHGVAHQHRLAAVERRAQRRADREPKVCLLRTRLVRRLAGPACVGERADDLALFLDVPDRGQLDLELLLRDRDRTLEDLIELEPGGGVLGEAEQRLVALEPEPQRQLAPVALADVDKRVYGRRA
jgi:hypothetical protein